MYYSSSLTFGVLSEVKEIEVAEDIRTNLAPIEEVRQNSTLNENQTDCSRPCGFTSDRKKESHLCLVLTIEK